MKFLLPLDRITISPNQGILSLTNSIGTVQVICPSYFFVKKQDNNNKISLLFNSKQQVKSLLRHVTYLNRRLSKIFFLRLKVRGLGYRFKKLATDLYRFYFTRTNYIYFHKPADIIIKSRKRRIILLSYNIQRLNLVFNQLLLLHKVGPYNRRGFTYPRRIIQLKPGKKLL